MLQMSIPFFVYKSVKKQKMRIVFSSGKQKTPLPISDSETIAGEPKNFSGYGNQVRPRGNVLPPDDLIHPDR